MIWKGEHGMLYKFLGVAQSSVCLDRGHQNWACSLSETESRCLIFIHVSKMLWPCVAQACDYTLTLLHAAASQTSVLKLGPKCTFESDDGQHELSQACGEFLIYLCIVCGAADYYLSGQSSEMKCNCSYYSLFLQLDWVQDPRVSW